jgi:hypothetical protein
LSPTTTTLLSAQEAKERLRDIVEGFFFRRIRTEDGKPSRGGKSDELVAQALAVSRNSYFFSLTARARARGQKRKPAASGCTIIGDKFWICGNNHKLHQKHNTSKSG